MGNADLIFAKASGAGKAGVAVFRLSGEGAITLARKISNVPLVPRYASLATIIDPRDGTPIDSGLVILFPGPESFTGEDVAELQLHGSSAVEKSLYAALQHEGARPADPGEFTRRALINGKLDLAQVEGLADLIDAETIVQRKQALGQLGGRLSKVADGWRDRLLAVLTPLEADIDFPDEEDVPAAIAAKAGPAMAVLIAELEDYLATAGAARQVREGLRVVLVGPPNAGKSSLLNSLLADERAIVSDTPGTTRDVVEARLDVRGVPVTLIDTAGLRDASEDTIEIEGMRRTRMEVERADIVLIVLDSTTDLDLQALVDDFRKDVSRETSLIAVLNKSDLPNAKTEIDLGIPSLSLSAKTQDGTDVLIERLVDGIAEQGLSGVQLTRERHELSVREAVQSLSAAVAKIESAPELAAEDVRMAARSLGAITGAVDVEEVLGQIFSSFCIGK